MASYTTNLNLKKPAGSENVAIGDINNNMDTIDTAYGTLNSKVTQLFKYFEFSGTPDNDGCIITDCPLSTYVALQAYNLGRDGWQYAFVQNNNKSTTYWVVKIISANAQSGTFNGRFVAINKSDINE